MKDKKRWEINVPQIWISRDSNLNTSNLLKIFNNFSLPAISGNRSLCFITQRERASIHKFINNDGSFRKSRSYEWLGMEQCTASERIHRRLKYFHCWLNIRDVFKHSSLASQPLGATNRIEMHRDGADVVLKELPRSNRAWKWSLIDRRSATCNWSQTRSPMTFEVCDSRRGENCLCKLKLPLWLQINIDSWKVLLWLYLLGIEATAFKSLFRESFNCN